MWRFLRQPSLWYVAISAATIKSLVGPDGSIVGFYLLESYNRCVQNRLLSHHELTHLVKSSVCVIVAEASDFGETLRSYQAIYNTLGIAAPERFPKSVFQSIGLAAHQIVVPVESPSLSANIIALRAKLLPAFQDADYATLAIADSLPAGVIFVLCN